MKKIFILTIFIFISLNLFAQDYNIKNKEISITLTQTSPNNIVFSEISNLETKKNMIIRSKTDDFLWSFVVETKSENIELFPKDAESMDVQKNKDKIQITWKNVKSGNLDNGFDVIATCKLKGIDSLWGIKIKSHTNKYSICSVKYPNVSCIDASEFITYPLFGGMFDTNFHGYYEYSYPGIQYPMQWTFVTKGDTTLYLVAQDPKGKQKYFSAGDLGNKQMVYYVKNEPINEIGLDYDQEYDFCMSPIKGDWYDAAKKYRKWGINSKFTPFSKGLMEKRKDIPQWYKELPVWLRHEGLSDENRDKIIKFAKYLDVPVASHTYYWSQHNFDTCYPNFLPAFDRYKEDIRLLEEAGIKVMPYTNGRLVDMALSYYGREYGKKLVALNSKGEMVPEVWEHAKGADNNIACPNSLYKDIQVKEFGNIAKDLGIDALYIDEVAIASPIACYNEEHSHPKGGGDNWTKGCNDLLESARFEMNKYSKEPVILTSEGAGEPYAFDGWLRCNEADPCINDSPVQSVIYSGYVQSFGFYYYPNEFEKENSIPAINKTAICLCKGYQLGWGLGWVDYEKYPNFAQYFKNACKARYKAYKYFNLGEMVRCVKITSEIPKEKIYFQNFALESNNEYPLVRTISHKYNNSACITFTNVSEKEIPINWESDNKSLGLSYKSNYSISEFYPNEKEISKGEIKGSFVLKPFETKIIMVK